MWRSVRKLALINTVYEIRSEYDGPHIVAGPGDKTDRYSYWPVRIDTGGEMIAPGDPANPKRVRKGL